jgi:hypothetical protein
MHDSLIPHAHFAKATDEEIRVFLTLENITALIAEKGVSQ